MCLWIYTLSAQMIDNNSTGLVVPNLHDGGCGILEKENRKEKPKEKRACGEQETGAGWA